MTERERDVRPGPHVEIGCGSASRSFSGPGQAAFGVDSDIDSLPVTCRSSEGWSFVCADALTLPFRNDSVGVVALQAVLHHLVPVTTALVEFARILRPGGILSIVDGVALSPVDAVRLSEELETAGLPGEPIYGFDLDELTDLVQVSGLVIEELGLDGSATFATPPVVSKRYTSDRFRLVARRTPRIDEPGPMRSGM